MVKASEVVYKYVEIGFAVKHKKDGFKAGSVEVSLGFGAGDKGEYKALKSIEKTRLFLNFKNGRASYW